MKPIHLFIATAPSSAAVAMMLAVGQPGKALGQDDPVTRGSRIAALGNDHGAPAAHHVTPITVSPIQVVRSRVSLAFLKCTSFNHSMGSLTAGERTRL
jgi:hypothetical protein